MSTAIKTEPLGFIVWHREHRKHARWKRIATTTTHTEAVARVVGKGDFHIAPIFDPALLEEGQKCAPGLQARAGGANDAADEDSHQ